MRSHWLLALLGGSCLGLLSCGPPKLSRSAAEQLIRNHPDFREGATAVRFRDQAGAIGAALDLWQTRSMEPLTTRGAEIFAASSGQLNLKEALPITVEVTGIGPYPVGDGEQVKVVEFRYELRALPWPLGVLAIPDGSGSATARLFDDGWRLEDVSYGWNPQPGPPPSDQVTRTTEESLKIREAREKRIAELTETIGRARTPTTRRPIVSGPTEWQGNEAMAEEVYLTDVSIVAVNVKEMYSQRVSDHVYWFDYIDEINPSSLNYKRLANAVLIDLRYSALPLQQDPGYLRTGSNSEIQLVANDEASAETLRQELVAAYGAWKRKFKGAIEERAQLVEALRASVY